MKKIFFLFLIFIISGCARKQESQLLPLNVILDREEKFIYGIYRKGMRIGELKILLKEEGEKKEIVKEKNKEIIRKEKVVVFKSFCSLPERITESKVFLYKKNFLPITHYKIIKEKKTDVKVYAEYLPNFVKIKLKKNKNNRDVVVETLGNYYDNETFLFALRYLEFSKIPEKEISAGVEIPEIASSTILKINVYKNKENKEEVETKAGKFNCLKIKMTLDGKKFHTAYYQEEKPNYLVKYENEKEEYILEKIE